MAGSLPSAVLFACTQNAVRSPMASGLMGHFYGHKIFVTSAGVIPQELDPFAVAALEEIGIDISSHEPRSFDELQRLREPWDRLALKAGSEIFLTYDWCRIWWKYYGKIET